MKMAPPIRDKKDLSFLHEQVAEYALDAVSFGHEFTQPADLTGASFTSLRRRKSSSSQQEHQLIYVEGIKKLENH